jgi:predicted nucleotidyltransferase
MTTLASAKSRAYVQAQALARYYLEMESVEQVGLFGSVAKNTNTGCGIDPDIDLILTVDRDIFYSFIDRLNLRIDYRPLYIVAKSLFGWRLEIIEELLGAPLIPLSSEMTIDYPADVFLFPLDWEDNINKIVQLSLPLRKRFVKKIWRDVRFFDETLGDFLPPRR